jgi:hypothetical protein
MSTSLVGSCKSGSFFCSRSFIFLLLMELRCDEISLEGNHKPVGTVLSKYTHAQKMRASMTHIFGRDFGLGKQDWTKNEQTGRMTGNPSTSHLLGTYMVSLRNRKVRNSLAIYFATSDDFIHRRFVQVMWLLVPAQSTQYVYSDKNPDISSFQLQGNSPEVVSLQPPLRALGFE